LDGRRLMAAIIGMGIREFAEAVEVEIAKAAGLLTTEAAIYLVVADYYKTKGVTA